MLFLEKQQCIQLSRISEIGFREIYVPQNPILLTVVLEYVTRLLVLAGFYKGVQPPMKQNNTDEQQDNVDYADMVVAKSEDAK